MICSCLVQRQTQTCSFYIYIYGPYIDVPCERYTLNRADKRVQVLTWFLEAWPPVRRYFLSALFAFHSAVGTETKED